MQTFRRSAYGYIVLLILAGFAFWPLYLSRLGKGIDRYTHWHAVLAVGWCGLLIAQPLLMPRHVRLHRRIGSLSYFLAPLFAAASLLLAHARFQAMDLQKFYQEAATLFLPLSAVLLFSVSYCLAMYYRRTLALHARFMILTGLPMIDPVLGRILAFYFPAFPNPLLIQTITFGLTDLIVLGLLLRPVMSTENRLKYGLPAMLFPAAHFGWFTVAQAPAWLPFASWFRGLPLR
jgi:hypothetical protein